MSSFSEENINYDSEALMTVDLDGIDYRLDTGKEGTAICISQRPSGTWDWSLAGEAKWDGTLLRCKALTRSITEALGRALRAQIRDQS